MSINNRLINTGGGAAPWDVRNIQSTTETNLTSVSGLASNSPFTLQVVGNGNYLLLSNNNYVLYLVPLSVPYDTSSAGTVLYTQSTGAYFSGARIFWMKEDGTRLYVSLDAGTYNPIRQYDLSIPYDIRSFTYSGIWNSNVAYVGIRSIQFAMGGTRCYAQGAYNRTLQLNLSTAWDISTATMVLNEGSPATTYYTAVSENGQYAIRSNVFYEMSTLGDFTTKTQIGTPSVGLTGLSYASYDLYGNSLYEASYGASYAGVKQHKIT